MSRYILNLINSVGRKKNSYSMMIMQNAQIHLADNVITQFDLYIIHALGIWCILFCILDWHWSTDKWHCFINLKTCRIPEVNWKCIYVICIHRCHLLLPKFVFCNNFRIKSYIGINKGQREHSPWATLLPHRWVQ